MSSQKPPDNASYRIERGNQIFDALKQETNRGQACVGDAFLDELVEELFRKRLIDDSGLVDELLSFNGPLGSHGHRLRVAYALGWIGPKTYQECRRIHKVRNAMAHDLDVDSFDHRTVSGIIDGFTSQEDLKPARLPSRKDKFLTAVAFTLLRIWKLQDDSSHAPEGVDMPVVPGPPG